MTLVAGLPGPGGIAAGSGCVYFDAAVGVESVAEVGSSSSCNFSEPGGAPIAVSSTEVYWVSSAGSPPTYSIMADAIDGGLPSPVSGSGGNLPGGSMASDGTSVYWSETSLVGVQSIGSVMRGNATVASGQNDPVSIAADATNAYWIDFGSQSVMQAQQDGGGLTVLASSQYGAMAIAVDSTNVYWTIDLAPGSILSVPIGGLVDGGVPTVVASGQPCPREIVTDSQSIYWTNICSGNPQQPGTIMGEVLDGGSPVQSPPFPTQGALRSTTPASTGPTRPETSEPELWRCCSPSERARRTRCPLSGGQVAACAFVSVVAEEPSGCAISSRPGLARLPVASDQGTSRFRSL